MTYTKTTVPHDHDIHQCVACGYPFDPGEACYQTRDEDLVCGAPCADFMAKSADYASRWGVIGDAGLVEVA